MSEALPLLATIPQGDGPKRATVRMRRELARIARRVATAALVSGREDVLMEVYIAGLVHGAALGQREGPEASPSPVGPPSPDIDNAP